MKVLIIASMLILTNAALAGTSIDKCVDAAMDGARQSLTQNEGLDSRKLYLEEMGYLINDDEQYFKTRKELEMLCRRLYIATIDLEGNKE